jgi:hypothetical protein
VSAEIYNSNVIDILYIFVPIELALMILEYIHPEHKNYFRIPTSPESDNSFRKEIHDIIIEHERPLIKLTVEHRRKRRAHYSQ